MANVEPNSTGTCMQCLRKNCAFFRNNATGLAVVRMSDSIALLKKIKNVIEGRWEVAHMDEERKSQLMGSPCGDDYRTQALFPHNTR